MNKKTYRFDSVEDTKKLNRRISKKMKDIDQVVVYTGFWYIANLKYREGYTAVEIYSTRGEPDRLEFIR